MFGFKKIPITWLSNDQFLIQSYFPDFSVNDYYNFKNSQEVKDINLFLQKYGKKLLKNISKFTGIPWYKKEIPIYLIPNIPQRKSFSYPLVLVLRENMESRIFVLAHEFTHINMMAGRDKIEVHNSKEKIMNLLNIEAICWLVGKLALEEAVGDWSKYKEEWKKILEWDKSGKTKKEIEDLEGNWNYSKVTLNDFYK